MSTIRLWFEYSERGLVSWRMQAESATHVRELFSGDPFFIDAHAEGEKPSPAVQTYLTYYGKETE